MSDLYTMAAIPAFTDNYIWLYINRESRTGIVVDPGDGNAALKVILAENIRLSAILITHHHYDHTGGIVDLVRGLSEQGQLSSESFPIYGPKKEYIPQITHPLSQGDRVLIPHFKPFSILDIPGHTKGHIAYYSAEAGMLFCGDTLFMGGCGRLFEGTPEILFNSLQKIKALPPETLIYCAHEYTEKNLAFALTVEPHNLNLQQRYKTTLVLREQQQPTVPATLDIEQKTNPFLRTDVPEIAAQVSRALGRSHLSEIDIFATLRTQKDRF